MAPQATPYLGALWIGAVLFAAGIVLDQRWHATHDEFEGTSQQFEAHWLLWIGFLVVLAAAVLAFLRLAPEDRHQGFTMVLAGSAVYLPVTVWHFRRPRQRGRSRGCACPARAGRRRDHRRGGVDARRLARGSLALGGAVIERALARAYERLGARYPQRAVVLQIQLGYLVWLVTLGGLALYVEMSAGEFLRLFAFGLAFFVVHNVLYARIVRRLLLPVVAWLRGERGERQAGAVWQAAAALPLELLRRDLRQAPLAVVF